jgi:D-amino-acid dehydrogenase
VVIVDAGGHGDGAAVGNAGIVAPGHAPLNQPGASRRALRWLCDRDAPLRIPWRRWPGLVPWLWRFQRACAPDHLERCHAVLDALGRVSADDLAAVVREEKIPCDWRATGRLEVYRSEEGRRHALAEAASMRRRGFAVEEWSRADLAAREPAYRDPVLGAVRYADGISLDPVRLHRGLIELVLRDGVELRAPARVADLLLDAGRCRGVRLADGDEICAATTVLAAGAWTARLARRAGLRLPLAAGRGYHLDLPRPDPAPRLAAVLVDTHVAVTPLADRLRLAGTLEFSGLNDRATPRRFALLLSGADGCLRDLRPTSVRSRWCGLRPCLPDGLPAIGWAPGVTGLHIVTGHGKMGLTLGAGSGAVAAAQIAGEAAPLDAAPLSPARFA